MCDSDDSSGTFEATFEIQGLEQKLWVISFEGEEGLSVPYRFNILLAAESSSMDFSRVVGQTGMLKLKAGDSSRTISGLMSHVQQHESSPRWTLYSAVLVPPHLKLAYTRDCCIFEDKDVLSIANQILSNGNLPAIKSSLRESIKREYCVQYRESGWDFINRLFEEEGYFYFFSHDSEGKTILHLGDAWQCHPFIDGSAAGPALVRFHPPEGLIASEEHIYHLSVGEALQPGKVTLADYNYQTPNVSQLGHATSLFRGHQDLEVFDYPGGYDRQGLGHIRATVRLQELLAQQKQAEGESNCLRFASGSVFTLQEHPRRLANDQYTLTWVQHRGERGTHDLEGGALDRRLTYSNRFNCMPRNVVFRPPRRTRRPRVEGVQTAIVTEGADRTPEDRQGQIMVRFIWSREEEQRSCWLRVAQPWAGQGWGALMLPRVGQEVVVSFVDGDPDRPLVTGQLYHARNLPPEKLPDRHSRTVIRSCSFASDGGFNEIALEDKAGKEELFSHAHRDQVVEVGHDLSVKVKHDVIEEVSGDLKRTVKGSQQVEVTSNASLETKARLELTSTSDGSIRSKTRLVLDAAIELALSCGAAKIVLKPSGEITIQGTMVDIKGAMVNVKADGLVVLQGALVKAN